VPAVRALRRLRSRNPLPRGAFAVGAGLLVSGAGAYGFLVVSARALGPERYAALSVLWVLTYTAGPGLFLPLEQEVGRELAVRRARGVGGAPVLRRAASLGAVFAVVLLALSAVGAGPAIRLLFAGDGLLLVGYALTIVGFWAAHLSRGAFAGTGRFGRYGGQLAIESVLRLAVCVTLAIAGVTVAGWYGLAIGAALIASVVLTAGLGRGLVTGPGPPAEWRDLSGALGFLLAASVLSQVLVNAGPVAVQLLARPSEEAEAGRFLAALVIARVPLFLFAAVQAALLPALAGLAGRGQRRSFSRALGRLVAVVAVIGAAASAVAFAVGPQVVALLFGEDYRLGRVDLLYLAAASGVYMVAVVVAHGLIALRGYRHAALGWFVGLVVFAVVTALGSDLLLRVELGFLAGAAAALLSLLVLLPGTLATIAEADPDPNRLRGASHQVALEP
jgi:O-antigen/teichoic acid export membrane protein